VKFRNKKGEVPETAGNKGGILGCRYVETGIREGGKEF
jgi:hypothetical protein